MTNHTPTDREIEAARNAVEREMDKEYPLFMNTCFGDGSQGAICHRIARAALIAAAEAKEEE